MLNNGLTPPIEYAIKYLPDGVFLKVYTAHYSPSKLDKFITRFITRKRVENPEWDKLRNALKTCQPFEIIIAEAQKEKMIDEEMELFITDDKMRAYITFHESLGGQNLEIYEIRSYIEKNLKFGIKKSEVEKVLRNKQYDRPILIAEGIEPQAGNDGILNFHFLTDNYGKPAILEDGSADFHNLNLIKNVTKGDILLDLVPPQPGKLGKTVLGEKIDYKKGIMPRINFDDTILATEDGTKLIAKKSGAVVYNNDKIKIVHCYQANHDIDSSTGDIKFNGAVVVNGNVRTGFTVESDGNMEVIGVVEGATIISKGHLYLKRGVLGHSKGNIRSDGTLVTRFIENATIDVKGELIAETIMHSHVSSGSSISVEGTKGLIVGGVVKARTEIEATSIGSEMGTKTTIEVGMNPRLKMKIQDLKTQLENTKKNIQKLEQSINIFKHKILSGRLPSHKKVTLIKMLKDYDIAIKDYDENNKRLKLYIAELHNTKAQGKIRVKDKIYPGVKILIGSETLFITEIINNSMIFQNQGKITIEAIS